MVILRVENRPYRDKIEIFHTDILRYSTTRYDYLHKEIIWYEKYRFLAGIKRTIKELCVL